MYPYYESEKIKLLTRKSVLPQECTTDRETLNDTMLHKKDTFFSVFNELHLSDVDYNRAQKIWVTFNVHTLREYVDLYQYIKEKYNKSIDDVYLIYLDVYNLHS